MNVDLCFVPATHQAEVRLPAVSGSSGKLVIDPPKTDATEAEYPGAVFAAPDLNDVQAMTEFVAASAKEAKCNKPPTPGAETESESLRIEKQQLRREEETLRAKRRGVRERRAQEDAAWQALKAERRAHQEKRFALRRANKRPPWGSQTAEDCHFKQLRQQRRAQIEQRRGENKQWRTEREHLRFRLSQLPLAMAWIAIWVITDNCTRQCLGLPMFVAGANVTAEMVVNAFSAIVTGRVAVSHFGPGPSVSGPPDEAIGRSP
jgi:regulator of replication initiation timing